MSKNTLYLECYEGITGEMVLGALKDLAEALETEEKDRIIFPKERDCAETGFSKERMKQNIERQSKEQGTIQEELLPQIDLLLEKLQIEKITASPVWSDKGPTDALGLAILARTEGACPERFVVKKVGTGTTYVNLENNTREPRTLRAMLIEEVPAGELWILESNIDDCAGEILGYTMDLLFEAGARDVWFTPIFMKKNRPAYQLSVLCAEDQIRALDAILFRETTTIGVRRYRVERTALPRRFFEVRVPGGTVRIKVCEQPDGAEKCYPEYEDVKRVARETGKSYREVYQTAKTTAEQFGSLFKFKSHPDAASASPSFRQAKTAQSGSEWTSDH